jgi:hypothetical protein
MQPATENKVVLIVRHTRLDDLIARFNTLGQAQFYVEHLGADFTDYLKEHETYQQSVHEARTALESLARVQVVDRSFLPNFLFGERDIVVALGQDGLVANTIKYLTVQRVLGVNPDPKRWDGVLLPFTSKDLHRVVPEVFADRRRVNEVTMAKAVLNNGQILYAVNDLFIGPKSHVSARYLIKTNGHQEQQSSSGIIVSTGLGSTGWFRSLMTGAVQITARMANQDLHIPVRESFAWNADYLYFTVREPFPSKTSSASLVFGKITAKQPLELVSQMPENGVIFSDGIESDFLEFNSGTQATISLAEKKGHLVV